MIREETIKGQKIGACIFSVFIKDVKNDGGNIKTAINKPVYKSRKSQNQHNQCPLIHSII